MSYELGVINLKLLVLLLREVFQYPITNYQLPIPHAPCPMPHSQIPYKYPKKKRATWQLSGSSGCIYLT
jgi:hypothetical protein